MSEALKTANHEVIRAWIEAREGRPAVVRDSGGSISVRMASDCKLSNGMSFSVYWTETIWLFCIRT
jgi:hypothetical protein